jgi:hypothetical protein
MPAHLSGQSWAVIAASEQGKGLWIKQWLRKARPAQLIIWDRVGEYGSQALKVGTLSELATVIRRSVKYKVRYVPRAANAKAMEREFGAFCQLAYLATGAVVLVEELSDVTTASFAPPAWRRLNAQGRHHQGLHIIGTSQSPAMIDKTFLANATLLHVGFLGTAAHRKVIAAELDIRPAEILALARGEWIELDRSSRRLSRGRVAIPGTTTGKVVPLHATPAA